MSPDRTGSNDLHATRETANTGVTPALINGEDITSDDLMIVRSPYDGTELSAVPRCDSRDIDTAVAVARSRLNGTPLTAYERAEILDRVAIQLKVRSGEFARLISAEAAKPINAARAEVARAVQTVRFSASAARALNGEMIPMDAASGGAGRLGFAMRVPIGVVACISPFNFPLNLVCHKIAPGVAAGVPMVLKPASATPLSALRIARLFEACGLPPGWLNVVTCPGSQAEHLVTHPDVAMITFTGSAEVGWGLRSAAPHKRIGLELGNSSPVIVTADADLDLAAERITAGGFGYSGQTCISVQRVYAQRAIHDQLLGKVVELAGRLGVGDPSEPSTTVSSLIDSNAAIRVASAIDQAVSMGARVVVGAAGQQPPTDCTPFALVEPTILSGVTSGMSIVDDEAFGPVIGFAAYDRLDDALEMANSTRYGLQAGIFTSNLNEALRAARELSFGGVMINDTSSYRVDQMPYGGVKESGNTREGPSHAVQEMTELRTVVIRG